MVASEVSWKYLCKIKRVIWSQTQYERNVSWSQRRRYIGPKIIWVLTYWWEYCLCMNCFVTQHLKHITTNGAAARSSAQRGARHTALAYWRCSPHTTLNTALSSSALRIQNWRLALFKLCTLCYPHHHLRPPTKGYNTRGGRRIATALGAAQAMHLFKKMQIAWQFLNATQVYNTMQCIRQRNLGTGLVWNFWAATISE